jgi:hypothetical protein
MSGRRDYLVGWFWDILIGFVLGLVFILTILLVSKRLKEEYLQKQIEEYHSKIPDSTSDKN